MGRWMEVLEEKPPAGADGHAERRSLVVGEIAPHPLIGASGFLKSEHRAAFPALDRVRAGSGAYVDERLWLSSAEAEQLLTELRRVRRLCWREEFLAGLDGRRYYDLWRQGETSERFEEWLDGIEGLLAAASTCGRWIVISL